MTLTTDLTLPIRALELVVLLRLTQQGAGHRQCLDWIQVEVQSLIGSTAMAITGQAVSPYAFPFSTWMTAFAVASLDPGFCPAALCMTFPARRYSHSYLLLKS